MVFKPLIRIVMLSGVLLSLAAPGASALFFKSVQTTKARKHQYHHEIEQIEEAWRKAMLQGNSAVLESLLADDYTSITAKGAIETKEQTVSSMKAGAYRLTTLTISDRKVRVYGATAVVTSQAELTGTKDNESLTGRYRYTRVYVRNQSGLWKIVSFEVNRIQESTEHK